MLLGAHVSISGGYVNAAKEAQRLAINTIQIFTKNQQQWKEKTVNEAEGKLFKQACLEAGILQAFSHTIYLISLASENDEIVEKSILSLAMEVQRCKTLGLTHTVLHPGAAGKLSRTEAIIKIGDNIKTVLNATHDNPVKILIENTAGQGTSVGGKIEYIADLLDYINSDRIGLCIDTCHAFAAGYDIRSVKGTKQFFKEIDKRIGLEKVLCFHLNDSKGGIGSKLDRHAHISEGLIGTIPFEYIMKMFPDVPKVLETPNENNADIRNLQLLRQLATK
ncbi:MAG: nfo [Bacteroidota bacterium]|jgi:deoxyribonuclease-4|nr:nfo [Bacteroidota bacterium]